AFSQRRRRRARARLADRASVPRFAAEAFAGWSHVGRCGRCGGVAVDLLARQETRGSGQLLDELRSTGRPLSPDTFHSLAGALDFMLGGAIGGLMRSAPTARPTSHS